jgi:undecaprenyl phosphate N,N'-diacetylbacillosamine 1-phosphate transferase
LLKFNYSLHFLSDERIFNYVKDLLQVHLNRIYNNFLKRLMDFTLSFLALIVLSPVLIIISILVRINLGGPILFKQNRPGKNEKIYTIYKFRTMININNDNGDALPDKDRLTKFGTFLRNTSLDEIPELINVLKGDMSLVGPRPQLVKDMIFMTKDQRKRHQVRPGLTGLAQIKGRNNLSWEDKLNYDIEYVNNIGLFNDLAIIFKTVFLVLKREGIKQEGFETAEDLGDYLLRTNQITKEVYKEKIINLGDGRQ